MIPSCGVGMTSNVREITPEVIEICNEVKGKDTGQYKMIVAEALIEHFKPINQEITYLMKNQDYLETLLHKGSMQAMEIAQKTLFEVKQAMELTR